MAIKKVVEIVANTKEAVNDIKKLYNELLEAELQQQELNEAAEDMEKAYKDSSKKSVKDLEKVGEAAKKQSKTVGGLKKVIDGVGTAFKAIGIGAVIALVAKLTQVLSENQKVMDFVSTVSNTLGIVINKIVTAITDAIDAASEATGGFDALGKVVGGVVRIAFNQLKTSILVLRGGFAALKLAYEKVFGDDEGVEKAKKELDEIGEKIKETIADTADAGKQIITNIGEAVDEVATTVGMVADSVSKTIDEIDLKSTYAQAQAITRSKRNFELLALQQQRAQLLYQYQAEALRQLRDDDTKAIADRIKANEQISEVLKKQFAAESATIKARISGLQQEQSLLGFTQDRQNEIYQLQTDLIDVAERLKGVESEQLSNKNSLLREQIDLQNTIKDAENERRLAQLDFEADQELKESAQIDKLILRLNTENQILADDLERKRELYAEGTQARIDAEQEYLTRKQEIDNEVRALNIKSFRLAEEEYQKDLERKKLLEKQKFDLTQDTFGKLSQILGENSEAGKAFASAQALINTYQGVTEIWANKTTLPEPFGTINKVASTALVLKSGLDAVKQINSVKTLGGGGGSSAPASAPTPPAFNLVQGTGTNQLAESFATQKQPVKAYVVSGEVSSQQALDNYIQGQATI